MTSSTAKLVCFLSTLNVVLANKVQQKNKWLYTELFLGSWKTLLIITASVTALSAGIWFVWWMWFSYTLVDCKETEQFGEACYNEKGAAYCQEGSTCEIKTGAQGQCDDANECSEPCTNDQDCSKNPGERCVKANKDKKGVCGKTCMAPNDCPNGYTCLLTFGEEKGECTKECSRPPNAPDTYPPSLLSGTHIYYLCASGEHGTVQLQCTVESGDTYSVSSKCEANVCNCTYGTPAKGKSCTENHKYICESCPTNFFLAQGSCDPNSVLKNAQNKVSDSFDNYIDAFIENGDNFTHESLRGAVKLWEEAQKELDIVTKYMDEAELEICKFNLASKIDWDNMLVVKIGSASHTQEQPKYCYCAKAGEIDKNATICKNGVHTTCDLGSRPGICGSDACITNRNCTNGTFCSYKTPQANQGTCTKFEE